MCGWAEGAAAIGISGTGTADFAAATAKESGVACDGFAVEVALSFSAA